MAEIIRKFLDGLKPGESMLFKNMEVIPLIAEKEGSADYITLEEALKKKLLEVTEKDQSGSVPNLRVVNKSDKKVLIVCGEELVGAKQNRTVNVSIMVGENCELIIPVTCCEQGRWHYTTNEFHCSGAALHSRLRHHTTEQISKNLAMGKGFVADQSEVWDEIHRKSAKMSVNSPTGAFHAICEKYEDTLLDYLRSFAHPGGCSGIIAAINGRIIAMDAFDSSSTMKSLWNRLIKSYTLDAIEDGDGKTTPLKKTAIRSFLESIAAQEGKRYQSVGIGYDLRINSEELAGSALLVDDAVVHITVFRKDKVSGEIHRRDIHRDRGIF